MCAGIVAIIVAAVVIDCGELWLPLARCYRRYLKLLVCAGIVAVAIAAVVIVGI